MEDLSKLIFESTYGSIGRPWKDVKDRRWKDFALLLLEEVGSLQTQVKLEERSRVSYEAIGKIDAISIRLSEYLSRALVLDNETEMTVGVFVSTINFYQMMLDYLPWYDKINRTFINLLKVLDISLRYLEEQIARVHRNLNLDTAIELLPYFESRLDIPTNPNLSYRQRRGQIRAVLKAMHSQSTEQVIKDLVSAFSANQSGVDVLKTDEKDVLEFKFVANGLPNNLEALEQVLKKVMPAHLAWKYGYTQNPWEEIITKKYKWKDVTTYTWTKINTYKGE